MRNFIILGVFGLMSLTAFGQTDAEYAQANAILAKNKKQLECYTYVATSYGIYIGSRTSDNNPINFVYRDGYLIVVPELQSYVVFGYSEKLNSLFVGYHDSKNKFADTMCRDFYTYDLITRKFKKQASFKSDIYRVDFKNDTLFCGVNTKNPGGIGSTIVRHKIAIK